MQKKHYLLFVSLSYSFSILRPLQAEVLRRGHKVAWYIEPGCPDMLEETETRLHTVEQVKTFDPIAVFAPGNIIPPNFPGVKVSVFHGYPIAKRRTKEAILNDDHFKIRGWFDMYCTQGPSSTEPFKMLEQQFGFFKVYETGWCKVDTFFPAPEKQSNSVPHILYATTFSKGITSAPVVFDTIARLAKEREWHWTLTFHPKMDDEALLQRYKKLADENTNVDFVRNVRIEDMHAADVMLCDSSSIIIEFMLLDKPVVTYRNTKPGHHLIDVNDVDGIELALDKAITRPKMLMNEVIAFSLHHESHRDGRNCRRILDAVDDFIEKHQGKLKPKPRNFGRKLKLHSKNIFDHFTKN